jgi:hypothetical protein
VSRSSTHGPSTRLVLLVMLFFGVVTAAAGVGVVRDATVGQEGWVVTEGRVVDHIEGTSSKGGMTYAPVVEYQDAAGTIHQVTSGVTSPTRDGIGTPLEVAYDPGNPGDARVVGGIAGVVWMLVAGVGLMISGFAIITLLGTRGSPSRRTATGPDAGRTIEHDAATDPRTGRVAFRRPGGRLQTIVSLGGGVLFLTVAQLGLMPGAIPSVMFHGFGALMIAAAILAFVREGRPVVEIGPAGVWLPGVGARAWSEFSDIRLETFTRPGRAHIAYRRLGFVPRDPAIVASQPRLERILSWIALLQYRVALSHAQPVEFAPLGVSASDLGEDQFDQLLAAVAAEVPLGVPAGEALRSQA